MSPLCNTSAPDPACSTATDGTNTLANNITSLLSNLTGSPDADDEDDVIWVPYLSVICLIAVCVALSMSFFRYWKRVKKRRRNLQDYVEYNIDLKRKRLFGMMRTPFYLNQEYFNASLDDSDFFCYTHPPFQNQYQYSQDFPSAGAAIEVQRGGLQRYESMASTIPSVTANKMERHCPQYTNQNQGNVAELELDQTCHQHCFVKCPYCWPVFQKELRNLLKSTGYDDLYHEQQKSVNGRPLNYKDSHHTKPDDYSELRKMKIIEGNNILSTNGFSNWNSSENQMTSRLNENEECGIEYQEMSAGNGARPKVNKRDSGFSLKKQKATEQFDEKAYLPDTYSIGNVPNTRVHSDSEIQQRKIKNPQIRAKSRDSFTKTRTDSSDDVGPTPSSSIQHSPTEYLEKKRSHLPGVTTSSAPSRSHFLQSHETYSPISRSVAFANTVFRDGGSPSDQAPPLFVEQGGVINYGFQTDSLSSSSTPQANMAEPQTSPFATVSNQNLTNCDETGDIESPTTGKKKKKSFLKTRRQLSDASMAPSTLVKEREVQTYSPAKGRNSWPPQFQDPRAHSIDLSVIDIGKGAFAPTHSTSLLPLYNTHGVNNDVHV